MCAGMGGAYIPLALTPHWSEGMTAGKGWIALALVVFASWLPFRLLLGALIFGGITILQFVGQARGWPLPSQFLNMLPYLVTILALSLISKIDAPSKIHFLTTSLITKTSCTAIRPLFPVFPQLLQPAPR